MPFDGIDTFETHPLAKLGAVEQLLATEQQWCKGRLRDAHGRHCLVGAIEAVDGRQMLQRVILQAAREVSGKRYWRIEFFNDDPRTTHADVLEVLQHARENIIAGMIGDPQPWHRRCLRTMRALLGPASDHGTVAHSPEHEYERNAGQTWAPGSDPEDSPTPRCVREAPRMAVLELQD
jgi:hypothetical protein